MKENTSIIIQLKPDETKGKLLIPLYIFVAEKLGIADNESIGYDCRRINIASNLLEYIYAAYREAFPEEYQRDSFEFDGQVTMLMARSGPKVDHELSDNQVEIFDGYIQKREDCTQ